jgi:uncharacterized membrane protein
MPELIKASGTKRFFCSILLFMLVTDIFVFIDMPVFRQVTGFLFLTSVPGLLILYILKLNNLGLTEKFVLSVGLSISFSMFAGLLINSVCPLFDYNRPLSTNCLLISFNIIILILAIVACFRNRNTLVFPDSRLKILRLSTEEKTFLLLPAFFPLLSILGMRIMNTTDNNAMLMALLFLIPAYTIFVAIKHKQVPDRVYPPMIFLTSISLVLLLGLRSNHIIGADAHTEYYLFQQTFFNGQWQILLNSTLDSCLSISILPTIYQFFLNINSEYLFKILYPLLFSISPLVVYLISRKYIGSFYAFLASLFFMSQSIFLGTAHSPRTNMAILFFALAIGVLFHDGLSELNKKLLFIIFAVSCIVSHYSTTYIFFFVLLLTWIGMEIIPKILPHRKRLAVSSGNHGSGGGSPNLSQNGEILSGATNVSGTTAVSITQSQLKKGITIAIVALFFMVLFFWYSQVTGAAFNVGVGFITATLRSLQDFFILESRGTGVALAFGAGLGAKGIPYQITFIFSWLTIAFIAIGVLTTLFRYRHAVAFPGGRESQHTEFLSQKFDAEFFVVSLVCSAILVAAVALPFVFVGYGMDRVYCQMMTVLSPFFVIGGIMVARFLRAKWAYLVIVIVLIPYFMCNTGTMYQVFGVPQEITLNSKGQNYDVMYVHEQETYAAKWLKEHVREDARIYADWYGGSRLVSQGGIRSTVYPKAFIEEGKPLGKGYIYLRYCGAVDGKVMDSNYQWHYLIDYQNEFAKRPLIYSNGGSQVWR